MLRFIGHIACGGVTVFVAGDDDQSLYSFRFAPPAGIQSFPSDYPGTGDHRLSGCFRCPPQVLAASQALIAAFPVQDRIAKVHHSLYATAEPPVQGAVHRWRFATGAKEAENIASSCQALVAAGMRPRDILIFLSNQRTLAGPILQALDAAGVPAEHPREQAFADGACGRSALSLLRIVCNPDDYVARRTLLGLRRGVGVATCCQVCEAVVVNGLNYRAVFDQPLPTGAFGGRALTAVNRVRVTCDALVGWQSDDPLGQRTEELAALLAAHDRPESAAEWQTFAGSLPAEMTLREVLDFLTAASDEVQAIVLSAVLVRIGREVPEEGPLPQRVRVMTMHGAKGLSARMVFVPGLEEPVMPGPRKQPYPGLVLEAARMLYVSITRARAACVVSLAQRRVVQGGMDTHTPSRFAAHLGGPFSDRTAGLTPPEVRAVVNDCGNL